jgi:diacylglycerol kinase family enzyme
VVLGALLVLGAVTAAWSALVRRGPARAAFTAAAVTGGAATVVVVLTAEASGVWLVVVLGMTVLSIALARLALRPDGAAVMAAAASPIGPARRGVLIVNLRSGDGKAQRFHLVEEARRRGIEPIVLGSDDDLEDVARDAIARGADVVGMAGGDGSQAMVASVAADADIAFVCVPAGTRNHFALDLGLERDDVTGALDAFGDARERRVDLGLVGDRVFVNNVSLGVYARVVQSPGYRDAKTQTASQILPELLGPGSDELTLQYTGPHGREHRTAQVVLVSNNPYVLTALGGFGTRARLDAGVLGIATAEIRSSADVAAFLTAEAAGRPQRFHGFREWSAAEFVVDSDAPVEAGVDGEAAVLDPPLVFRSLPGALRVRLPPTAPGLSPASARPHSARSSVAALVRVAGGRACSG